MLKRAYLFSLLVHGSMFGAAGFFGAPAGHVKPFVLPQVTLVEIKRLPAAGKIGTVTHFGQEQKIIPQSGSQVVPQKTVVSASATAAANKSAGWDAAPALPGVGAKDEQTGPGGWGQPEISYQDAIKSRIEQARRYPELALARKLEGVVNLTFVISDNGIAEGLRVIRSSGFKVLDQEALATVKRAMPFPVPGRSRENGLPMEVAVKFVLRGD